MTAPAPSPDEQISALLCGRALDLAQRWTGRERLEGHEYAEVFTVTRADVHAYVEQFGVPNGAWSAQPGVSDGLYMIQVAEGYEIYFQERGARFDAGLGTLFKSVSAAQAALTDYLLAMSGCGLFPSPMNGPTVSGRRAGWLPKLKALFSRANEA
jgi:hypothetical protein